MKENKKIILNKYLEKQEIEIIILFLGIILRFIVMSIGYNFDFESYVICGKLGSEIQNVYTHTGRYNYAPLFFLIQSGCYSIAKFISGSYLELTYRILIVSVLTVGDLIITAYIKKKYGMAKAVVFFLNPISIIITGYHNQFDNLAIALLLLSTLFYSEEKEISKRDMGYVIFMGLSLSMKHIAFLIPVWTLLRKKLPIKKKILYSVIPVLIFLLSFVPFIVCDNKSFDAILRNVFKYKGYNNAPLLKILTFFRPIQENRYIFCFIGIMILFGIISRKMANEKWVLMYLLCMVAFSSAIAEQYFIIPLVALLVLAKYSYVIYVIFGTVILFGSQVEFGTVLGIMQNPIGKIVMDNGYLFICLITLMGLVEYIYKARKSEFGE